MNFSIRKALKTDLSAIIGLYREVAEEEGGLARNSEEITTEYIQYTFDKARHAGEMYVIEERGFSGAEIEQAVVSALYAAHAAQAPVDEARVLEEVRNTRPLSVLMAEQVNALRDWARSRTVPAD